MARQTRRRADLDVSRTKEEIHVCYQNELRTALRGLIANWQFNDADVATAADSAGTHTATLFGNAARSTDVPQLVITGAVAPQPNAAGWNRSDVTATFTCTDNASGVATCPASVTLSTEGANQTISGTATNKAGNSVSASVIVNLDKTPLVASMTAPVNGAALNAKTPTLSASVTDSLSGVANVQFQLTADNGATWTSLGAR